MITREGMAFMQLNEQMVREVVAQVIAEMQKSDFVKCRDEKSGVMSIDGSKVVMEPFDTGRRGDKVWLKDVITSKENKNLAAGLMKIQQTEFPWTLNYDEVDYVIEGQLTIRINGCDIVANAGDMVLIPAGSSIVFSALDHARFVYVTYPANWSEQAEG